MKAQQASDQERRPLRLIQLRLAGILKGGIARLAIGVSKSPAKGHVGLGHERIREDDRCGAQRGEAEHHIVGRENGAWDCGSDDATRRSAAVADLALSCTLDLQVEMFMRDGFLLVLQAVQYN